MAFERLSFAEPGTSPEGLSLEGVTISQAFYYGLLTRFPHLIEPLELGLHNLTPKSWTKDRPSYELEVLSSGLALLRSEKGTSEDWGNADHKIIEEFGITISEIRRARRTIVIPKEANVVFISGHVEIGSTERRLYEVIYHTIGLPITKTA